MLAIRSLLPVLLSSIMWGCASAIADDPLALAAPSSSGGAGVAAPPARTSIRSSRPVGHDFITAAEIETTARVGTAFDLVLRRRPNWLRQRNGGDVQVYRDGVRLGDRTGLRQIPIHDVGSISFLNGIVATQRFGSNHSEGAIVVQTRSGA